MNGNIGGVRLTGIQSGKNRFRSGLSTAYNVTHFYAAKFLSQFAVRSDILFSTNDDDVIYQGALFKRKQCACENRNAIQR